MRRILTLGATIALGLSTMFAATPAQAAATGYDRCPQGYLCLFSDNDGNGTMAYFKFGSPDLRGQSMDNRASSFANRSGQGFSAYLDYNYQNCVLGLNAYYTAGENLYHWWNADNTFSSVKAGSC
ncbi:peptidase inhibitor family I36 protein [Longispora sp. NPDC051575]|uniref:peptidase inhibitor family I36 protein n=1 Tax=Longispora sp. NPDC051575 TaxID=3154943 RepID=UPI00344A3739